MYNTTIVHVTDDGVHTVVFADERLNDFDIAVTDTKPPAEFTNDQICVYQKAAFQGQKEFQCQGGAKTGRYVVIRLRDQGVGRILTLCEVGIMKNGEY